MGLKIHNEIKSEKIDLNLLKSIYKATLSHFDLKDVFDVEVTIVDDETIKKTNKEYRGIDKVTDILSFPSFNFSFPFQKDDYIDFINPQNGKILLGDLMLCEKRAQEQAIEYNHSFNREVGFLILHGLLHLLGFDHIEKDDEKIMMAHSKKILEDLNLTRDV